jgi:hypothetical protein
MAFIYSSKLKKFGERILDRNRRAKVQIKYLMGDGTPAQEFLELFRQTAIHQPLPGKVGKLRGYSSMSVVADYAITNTTLSAKFKKQNWVVKFETQPGRFLFNRLKAENHHEILCRRYLNPYIPKTLRVIGHGLRNKASVLTYQHRVDGLQFRDVRWTEINANPKLCENLLEFCERVLLMCRETGQVPDLCGNLPRLDWFSNIFWLSRNILIDKNTGDVWLVDPGGKEGEESLFSGPLMSKMRTHFRLYTMLFFRWKLSRQIVKKKRFEGS